MTTTWVLLIAVAGSQHFNGVTIVPNLVSYQECARVSKEIISSVKEIRSLVAIETKCIEVRTK